MFDLERGVARWRGVLERESSLSRREVDELEDHLRARVDLEMELDGVLAPEKAFAIARRELGRAPVLSKEFAKTGKPRWRLWLFAGWATFAASFVLTGALTLPSRVLFSPVTTLGQTVAVLITYLSPLTNLLMLATLLELRAARPGRTRWLAGLVSFAAVINLVWMVLWTNPFVYLASSGLGFGISAWIVSFFCVATALWMRARELKPATPEPTGAR